MNKQYFKTYSSVVLNNINRALSAINWDNFTEFSSVHEDYGYFMLRVVFTLHYFASIKEKISKTVNKKPWINAGLLKSCKYQQKLFIKALYEKIPWCNYTKYRNKLNKLLLIAKKKITFAFCSKHIDKIPL